LAEHAEYLALAGDAGARQQRWRSFLLGADPLEEVVRRGDWAVGDEAFRARALQEQGRPAPRRRGRPPKVAAGSLRISPQPTEAVKEA
jgi:hypothetical protein